MKKTLFSLMSLLILAACNEHPPRPVNDVSRTVIVGQHEECTLYRTETTVGPNVTWVRCGQKPKVSGVTESCGRGCLRKIITTEEP